MDLNKIASASKRIAAALSCRLGCKYHVEASTLNVGMSAARASVHVVLPTVDIICAAEDRAEVDAVIAKACSKSRGWTVYASRISADGASYGVSIASTEAVALARAMEALSTTVEQINAWVHMSAATRYNKAREYAEGARAGEAAVNAYYERTALNVKIDQCIRRLTNATNARDVALISGDVQRELEPIRGEARAMLDAAKTAAASEVAATDNKGAGEMDMKKVMAAKRKAASLEKALKGTGAEVTIIDGYTVYGISLLCPTIKVSCDGERCSDAYNITCTACARRGCWVVVDTKSAPGMRCLTITTTECNAIHRAAVAIGEAVFAAGWAVAHAARVKHGGNVDAGQAAIARLYGTDDMQTVAAAYIARLNEAKTSEDVAAIADAVVAEVNGLKSAYDAQEAAEAAAPAETPAEAPVEAAEPAASTAAPEAVEIVETATYTVDGGVEHMVAARVDGVDVGGASVIVYDDGDAYIERIDVDDGYRNRGYGTAMLKQLAKMYGDVYLAPDNDGARRLYARLGDDVTARGSWSYVDQGWGVYVIAA